MKRYILSIDQGTTGTTALAIGSDGVVLGSFTKNYQQIYPKEGWVEQKPDDILKSVKLAISGLIKKTKLQPKNIISIGITNQRETVVLWDQNTGKALYNAIVWQCRRSTEKTEEMKKEGLSDWVRKKTGLTLDPYFSATKMQWLFENLRPGRRSVCMGTIDSFLIWNLTGGKSFFTEPSNASRTQVYNIKNHKWDSDLLNYFKIEEGFLPEVISSNDNFGTVKGFKPLIDGTPINAVLGDQQSSLFAHGAFNAGEAKCTYGTGSFILMNIGEKLKVSKAGLLTTVAWSLKNKKTSYAFEGGAFNCASSLNWLQNQMGLIKKSSDIGEIAKSVKDSHGCLFAPTLSGLGAPIWSPETRGAFIGLSLSTTKSHLCRAVLEGLSFQNELTFRALEKDFKGKISNIFVDGGASQSDEFMKIQSKMFGRKVTRPINIETTALGVAYLSGVTSGVFKNESSVQKLNKTDKVFNLKPSSKNKESVGHYEIFFNSLKSKPFTTF